MDKTANKLWVAALRSGKYTQSLTQLRGKGNSRCCLGVLCDVYRIATGRGRWKIKGQDGSPAFTVDGCIDNGYLPPPVQAWAGLPKKSGDLVTIDNVETSLARHNDSGVLFPEIADAIESQL